MLSSFVSVIIRMAKITVTTNSNVSNFDAKELMLSIPKTALFHYSLSQG